MKIGDPVTMSVDDARKAAKARLAHVDSGGDPKKDRDKARNAPTIREIAELYLQSSEFASKTIKVQANDRARIETHILPRIAGEKADTIVAPAARRLQQQISNDTRRNKRKRQLGGIGAARKVLRLLAAVLRWAKDQELITVVPFTLRELDLGGDGSRDAVITSPQEYARLFSTMTEMVAIGVLRPEVRAFFILVASTGLRRSEAQSLLWAQVNLEQRQITLTATKSSKLSQRRGKSGTKTEIVGLPPIAAAVLAELRTTTVVKNGLVFLPKRGTQLAVNRSWIAVRKAAGLSDDLTLHGLRHSVGTVGAIAGMSMPELQALLRHKQPSTTARYIHMARMAGGLADKAMARVLPAPDAPIADAVLVRRGVR